VLSAIKVASITSILSAITGIECTSDSHPKSFTVNRIKLTNPLLLFLCLGTVANFVCYLIHSPFAPFSTSRSRTNLTNPVLGGFNPRRIGSTCLVSCNYFNTTVVSKHFNLRFLSPLTLRSSGSLHGG
jgi:hypothetical protein